MKLKRKEELEQLRKDQLDEYHSRRSLLAREKYNQASHDYSQIFDFAHDNQDKRHFEIRENIRAWIRHALISGLSYDDIKGVVISEFRLHKQAMENRRNISPKKTIVSRKTPKPKK
ncbi:MAG: hypothetical protein MUE54_08535 [Anaerolineae bacterium]|jgi:hypothetical protein|nr:hypothetical protein [Anaerolineae bacterium]